MTVPMGGVSMRSMVNRVPYLPLLSWAAMQLFSMHRLWVEGAGRARYPPRRSPRSVPMGSSKNISEYARGWVFMTRIK